MSTIECETVADLLTSEPEIKSSKYYYYKKNLTTIIIENVTKIAKVFPTGEVKIVLPNRDFFNYRSVAIYIKFCSICQQNISE